MEHSLVLNPNYNNHFYKYLLYKFFLLNNDKIRL